MNMRSDQRGIALYVSVLLLVVMLGIALGLSAAFLNQLESLRGTGRSVLAFYATDAGVERVLYIDAVSCESEETIEERVSCLKSAVSSLSQNDRTLENGSYYELEVDGGGENSCPLGSAYCATSIGVFQEARRAVRTTR